MKCINFLIVVLAIFLSINSNAQLKKVSIKVGEPENKDIGQQSQGIVGTTDEGFYVLRTKNKGFRYYNVGIGAKAKMVIDYYTNSNFTRKKSVEIEDIFMETVSKVKGKTFKFFIQDPYDDLYIYYTNSTDKDITLYKKKLDNDSFTFTKESIVTKINLENVNDYDITNRSTFKAILSNDHTKMAIYFAINKKKEEETFVYTEVFDEHLFSIWKNECIVDNYSEGNYKSGYSFLVNLNAFYNTTNTISLSNDGVLNMMFKVPDEESKKSFLGAKTEFLYKLFSFSKDSKEPVIRPFANKSAFIIELMLKHDENDNLRLAGLYGNDNKFNVDGVMYLELDPVTLKTNYSKLSEFTEEDRKVFAFSSNEKQTKKVERKKAKVDKRIEKGKELFISFNYSLYDLYQHSDNSFTLASEYFDTKTITHRNTDSNGNTTTSTETKYIYGDLVFVNVAEDGEINWIKNFNKSQVSEEPYILSIADFFIDDDIYFIYNDLVSRTLKLGVATHEGELITKSITDLGRKGALEKFWFIPSSINNIGDDTYIGSAQRILRKKWIKFSFE